MPCSALGEIPPTPLYKGGNIIYGQALNNFNLSPFTLSLSKGKLRAFARSSVNNDFEFHFQYNPMTFRCQADNHPYLYVLAIPDREDYREMGESAGRKKIGSQ